MRVLECTDKIKLVAFESTGDYLDHIEANKPRESWEKYGKMPFDDCSLAETGGLSFTSALKTAREGWKEGLKLIEKELNISAEYTRKTWVNDYSGAMPNVPAVLMGVPQSMYNLKSRESNKKPVLSLFVGRGFLGRVNGGNYMNFGIALIELVDSLESQGYSVELNSAAMTQENGIIGSIITLKRAGDILDLEKLIFFMAHPAMHRRLEFYMRTVESDANEYVGSMMGNTLTPTQLEAHKENDAILIAFDAAGLMAMKTADIARKMVNDMFFNHRPDMKLAA